MHKVYRQIIFAVLSVISLAITCNRCRQRQAYQQMQIGDQGQIGGQGWTPALEQQMRDVFYQQSAKVTSNEQEKNQFADCCMEKMKAMFPNGVSGIETKLTDSVRIAIMKMGSSCALSLKSLGVWNAQVVEQVKLAIYSYPDTKMLPQKMKKEYVDCLTFKIEAKFPNGIKESTKDSLKKFIKAERPKCLNLLVNKYGNTKTHAAGADTASPK